MVCVVSELIVGLCLDPRDEYLVFFDDGDPPTTNDEVPVHVSPEQEAPSDSPTGEANSSPESSAVPAEAAEVLSEKPPTTEAKSYEHKQTPELTTSPSISQTPASTGPTPNISQASAANFWSQVKQGQAIPVAQVAAGTLIGCSMLGLLVHRLTRKSPAKAAGRSHAIGGSSSRHRSARRAMSRTSWRSFVRVDDVRLLWPKPIASVDAIVDQGEKEYQEDRCVIGRFGRDTLIAIFDGHGGHDCSAFCKKNIHKCLLKKGSDVKKRPAKTFASVFQGIDRILKDRVDIGGTTALCSMVSRTGLTLAWVGDTEGWVYRKGEPPIRLMVPHNSKRPDERARVHQAGGKICENGRVEIRKGDNVGHLSMTRALGDVMWEDAGVISVPEVVKYRFRGSEEYFVLASDGFWDYMTPDETRHALNKWSRITLDQKRNGAASFLLTQVQRNREKMKKRGAAHGVTVTPDNCSIVVLTFGPQASAKSHINIRTKVERIGGKGAPGAGKPKSLAPPTSIHHNKRNSSKPQTRLLTRIPHKKSAAPETRTSFSGNHRGQGSGRGTGGAKANAKDRRLGNKAGGAKRRPTDGPNTSNIKRWPAQRPPN